MSRQRRRFDEMRANFLFSSVKPLWSRYISRLKSLMERLKLSFPNGKTGIFVDFAVFQPIFFSTFFFFYDFRLDSFWLGG